MNLHLKKLIASLVSILVIFSCLGFNVYGDDILIPGTNRHITEFDNSFLSVTGFAKGKVNDRSEYIGTEKYAVVNTEAEFLYALEDAKKGNIKVIEVTNDLDLGFDNIPVECQYLSCLADYKSNMAASITNPAVMTSGISQVMFANINGLTIFSKSGVTIRRAEWKLQSSSSDLIIRNIKFDGMWQWSEAASTKEAGWSAMKVNGAKGVWFDHCSFTMGFDGLCDSENGASGVTYSWCTFGSQTTSTPDQDSNIYQNMSYMEYLYQNDLASKGGVYYLIRKSGVSFEDLLAYTAFHHKAFLIGSGDKDYKDNEELGIEDGNQRLEVTFAYSSMTNLGSRVVRMRQGKGHMFNCYHDNLSHQQLGNKYPILGNANLGINRCIDANCGGSVAADTCVYNGVDQVIIGQETCGAGGDWATYFQNAKNSAMIVNSKVTTVSGNTYTGNSTDNNGDNLFYSSYNWTDKSTLGKFCWNTTINGVENMKRLSPPTPVSPFTFNYDYDYKLPYDYKLVSLDKVEDVVKTHSGAYKYNQDEKFWLRIDYKASENFEPATENVPVTGFQFNINSYNLSLGSTIQLLAEIEPSNATDRKIIFTSSNPDVAEITNSGLIIGKNFGNTTITAASANGVSKSIEVEVYMRVTGLSLNSKSKSISTGETYQLVPSFTPENVTNSNVTWKSSNESIATVSASGLVTGVSAGNVTITCTSEDNTEAKSTCKISVKEGSAATSTPVPSETVSPTYPPKMMGDVNGDSVIDANDALMVLKHAARISLIDDSFLPAADLDNDNNVNASDALIILKIAANIL